MDVPRSTDMLWSLWIRREFHGHTTISTNLPDIHGYPMNYRDSLRIPVICHALHEFPRNSTDSPRILTSCSAFQGCTTNSRDLLRIPGICHDFHGFTTNSMDLLRLPVICHDIRRFVAIPMICNGIYFPSKLLTSSAAAHQPTRPPASSSTAR